MKKLLSVLLVLSMLLTPVLGNADETWSTGRQGYQSEVKVYITYNEAGERLFIRVDCSGETDGVGTRVAENGSFLKQFLSDDTWFVPGINCDVVSGATVTSKAIIDAVNGIPGPAWNRFKKYTTGAQGFQSEVLVRLGYTDTGVIGKIDVFAEGETEGIGARCGYNTQFLNQFIGKVPPFVAGENCDVISGATITSNAVIECINRMLPPEQTAE